MSKTPPIGGPSSPPPSPRTPRTPTQREGEISSVAETTLAARAEPQGTLTDHIAHAWASGEQLFLLTFFQLLFSYAFDNFAPPHLFKENTEKGRKGLKSEWAIILKHNNQTQIKAFETRMNQLCEEYAGRGENTEALDEIRTEVQAHVVANKFSEAKARFNQEKQPRILFEFFSIFQDYPKVEKEGYLAEVKDLLNKDVQEKKEEVKKDFKIDEFVTRAADLGLELPSQDLPLHAQIDALHAQITAATMDIDHELRAVAELKQRAPFGMAPDRNQLITEQLGFQEQRESLERRHDALVRDLKSFKERPSAEIPQEKTYGQLIQAKNGELAAIESALTDAEKTLLKKRDEIRSSLEGIEKQLKQPDQLEKRAYAQLKDKERILNHTLGQIPLELQERGSNIEKLKQEILEIEDRLVAANAMAQSKATETEAQLLSQIQRYMARIKESEEKIDVVSKYIADLRDAEEKLPRLAARRTELDHLRQDIARAQEYKFDKESGLYRPYVRSLIFLEMFNSYGAPRFSFGRFAANLNSGTHYQDVLQKVEASLREDLPLYDVNYDALLTDWDR